MAAHPADPPKIEVHGVTKRFGGTVALDRVDVSVHAGRVHALVGENGAGKSTLGKSIAGLHMPDEGTIAIDGEEVELRSPSVALAHSITMVAQELSLLPGRSVVDNVLLGIETTRGAIVDRRADIARFEHLAQRYGFDLQATTIVSSLSVADQQKVEILRALAREAEVIVMDEPTARLSSDEAASLTNNIRLLADSGVTVVFVSHFLDEVLAVADDVTIMRNGKVVRSGLAADETKSSLIEAMVGRSIDAAFPPRPVVANDAPIRFRAEGLSRDGAVDDVSFELRAGEIVAIAGLVGAGRTELARLIFGADRASSGSMWLDGEPFSPRSPRAAVARGVGMIPESRRDQALLSRRTVGDNVALAHLDSMTAAGVVRTRDFDRRTKDVCAEVNLTGATTLSMMDELSGGNQQKSVFARWLVSTPSVLIADEPTRGVDVGAKRGIYELMVNLADEGISILMISSEIEEVLGIANRILVMRSGRIAGVLPGETSGSSDVMNLAFGLETV